MNILKINKEDIKNIYEIDKLNFTSDSYSFETLTNYANNKNILFTKLIDNDIIVGFSIVLLTKPEAELLKICIIDKLRNKSYGKILLNYNIDYLTNNKFDIFYLEVRDDNIYAIKLYEKLGFIKYNIRDNYYKNPNSNAILYKKNLNR